MKPIKYIAQALCFGLIVAVAACSNKPPENTPKAQMPPKETAAPSTPAPVTEAKPPEVKPSTTPVPPPTPAPAVQAPQDFKFSGDNSAIGFVGYNLIGGREGGFSNFEGKVTVTDGKLDTTVIDLTIDMPSVFSDSGILTPKLKGDKGFFEVDKFPKATFKSTKAVKDEKDPSTYMITGNLNLHGVEKAIAFPAKIELKDKELTAKAEFSVNRHEWQIEYAGEGDYAVKDDVLIRLDVKATLDTKAAADSKAAPESKAASETKPAAI